MKKLVIITCFFSLSAAQQLIVSVDLGVLNHIQNFDPNNPPKDPVVPSFGMYYDDGLLAGAGLRFSFIDCQTAAAFPFLGCAYSFHQCKDSHYPASVLGENLQIHDVDLFAGYGFNMFRRTIFSLQPSVMIGTTIASYRGKTSNGQIETVHTYQPAGGFIIGSGLGFHPDRSIPLWIGFLFVYRIINVQRDEIKFYENGEYKARFFPTGDLILPDNNATIAVNVSYASTLLTHQRKPQ